MWILQGPVAAKWSIVKDEPVKDLGNINKMLIKRLLERKYGGDELAVPTIDYLAVAPQVATYQCYSPTCQHLPCRRVRLWVCGRCLGVPLQRLWTSMMMIFLHAIPAGAAEKLLTHLITAEEVVLLANAKLDRVVSADISADVDEGKQARNVWVKLFVDLLRVCNGDAMRTFWECEEGGMQLRRGCGVGRAVWRRCVEKWRLKTIG